MDKREMKTRQAVFDAMAELLKEKDFESVSVTDLLKQSKVSRSTFYSHFSKKEDVIKELCDELFNHVFSPNLKKEKGHDFSSYSLFDYEHLLTHFLFHIQEDSKLIKAISSSSASMMFDEALKEKLGPLFTACVKSKTIYRSGMDEDLQAHLFTESFIALLHYWIQRDCLTSPVEIAQIFSSFAADSTCNK